MLKIGAGLHPRGAGLAASDRRLGVHNEWDVKGQAPSQPLPLRLRSVSCGPDRCYRMHYLRIGRQPSIR